MSDPRPIENLLGLSYAFYRANSRARSHGRGFVNGETAGAIIPKCVPWPHSVDSNGQAFPSGLLGICTADSYTVTETAFNAGLLAVPDTLPSGYNARYQTDHNICPGAGGDTRGQFAPLTMAMGSHLWGQDYVGWGFETDGTASPQAPRVMTEAGLVPNPWMPEQVGATAVRHLSGVLGDASIREWGPTTGARYVRVNVDLFNPANTWPGALPATSNTIYTKWRFQIGYYNNGAPATASPIAGAAGRYWLPPDVLVYSHTANNGVAHDTGWLDSTAYPDLLCPLGTRRRLLFLHEYYFIQYTSSAGTTILQEGWNPATLSGSRRWPASEYIGRRCDVPLPVSVVGENNLVAPGGVVW